MTGRASQGRIAWRRLFVRVLLAASLLLLGLTVARIALTHSSGFGDLYAYYYAWDDGLYTGRVGGAHAYLYSPVFAQAIWPVTLLPFWAFYAIWMALNVACLVYLVGWRWAGWVAALFYPVTLELAVGNIHLLLAASMVLAMRHSAWWAFSLLTKVTPGVGLLYEWRRPRRVAVGLGVTLAIAAVSALLAPALWAQWIGLLASSSGTVDPWAFVDWPLAYRLPIAVGIVLVAGWKRWPWMVPVGVLLALPVIWIGSLCALLAIPRLRQQGRPQDRVGKHDRVRGIGGVLRPLELEVAGRGPVGDIADNMGQAGASSGREVTSRAAG